MFTKTVLRRIEGVMVLSLRQKYSIYATNTKGNFEFSVEIPLKKRGKKL